MSLSDLLKSYQSTKITKLKVNKQHPIRNKALLLLLSRFSRVRLCDPTDGSPPGSAVPGILQGKTLEWVAISFSNVWNWKVKVKLLSCVRLFVTPWTVAYQAPPSMGFSRQEYWSGLPLPSPNKAQRRFNFLVNIWKPTLEKESSYIW